MARLGGKITRTAAPLALSVIAASFGFASLAGATTAPRTFVASTGVDGNAATNCQASAPCRSFATALTVTSAGGEIIAVDTAGYGANLMISQAVSIIGPPGGAEVTVGSGQTAITINPGSGNTVILRNIVVNGGGVSNTTGIVVDSGNVLIEKSVVKSLTTGIIVNSTKVDIADSDILYNGTGISTTGTGIDTQSNPGAGLPGPTEVRLAGGRVIGNTSAFFMSNPGTSTANPPANDVTIFLYQPSGGLTTFLAGNGSPGSNFTTSGSGTSCTAQVNNCTAPESFNNGGGNINQK